MENRSEAGRRETGDQGGRTCACPGQMACAQGVIMEMSKEGGLDVWETGLTGLGDELDSRSEERGPKEGNSAHQTSHAVCRALSLASCVGHLIDS